ncbi:hypothetical protein [Halalkalibacter oceani]|uniref:hypothetical protein n=1 Tax=Halalkalibacter oceani TaxID=1653776 RepID=UPI00339B7C54
MMGNRATFTTDDFGLREEYLNISRPVGSTMKFPMEYYRLKGRLVFHEEDMTIKFRKGNKVNINNDEVVIEDVMYGLDNTITYHTDKIIKEINLNAKEDAIDEFISMMRHEKHNEISQVKTHNKKWWKFW